MFTKEQFIKNIEKLCELQKVGYKAEQLFQVDFTTEGWIGDLYSLSGNLLLSGVVGENENEIPDDLYEKYWNTIYGDDNDLKELYEELKIYG